MVVVVETGGTAERSGAVFEGDGSRGAVHTGSLASVGSGVGLSLDALGGGCRGIEEPAVGGITALTLVLVISTGETILGCIAGNKDSCVE